MNHMEKTIYATAFANTLGYVSRDAAANGIFLDHSTRRLHAARAAFLAVEDFRAAAESLVDCFDGEPEFEMYFAAVGECIEWGGEA